MHLLALQDLFRRHRGKEDGVWKLGAEPARTIFLDNGDIVFAQSTHPTDRLTFIMVEKGKITQAQLDYAMANLKPGLSIGKNLIEMGFITQRDLLEVARAQVERIVQASLGTAGEMPSFLAKELEPNVVRLPFDTPAMLLGCVLGIKDREGLLEALGPLNQVVVLEGRRLFEINLPLDLAKLPSLLNGGRTLLELARESGAEPLRVGAFALFLREMGWARLHELPPLDRGALDLALRPEPEPLTPPLPLPDDESRPNLIATIKAAERPTTNLEHLSESLDQISPEPEPVLIPEPEEAPTADGDNAIPPWNIITGRIEIPTPQLELPEPPEFPEDRREEEPALPIAPPAELQEEFPAPEPSRRFSPLVWMGVASVLLGLVLAAGFWWKRTRSAPPAVPPAVKLDPAPKEKPAPVPEPKEAPKPAEPAAAPPVVITPKPTPAKQAGIGPEERLAVLRGGDITTALDQGARHLRTFGRNDWTLRLEIACQGETLQKAARMLEDNKPDLFLLPLAMRDGRTCYQVFLGRYPSKAAAEKAIPGLPGPFRAEGNRPRAFRVDEIPE